MRRSLQSVQLQTEVRVTPPGPIKTLSWHTGTDGIYKERSGSRKQWKMAGNSEYIRHRFAILC